jgi:hypothetical protein
MVSMPVRVAGFGIALAVLLAMALLTGTEAAVF